MRLVKITTAIIAATAKTKRKPWFIYLDLSISGFL
jgi:hypothetical protein